MSIHGGEGVNHQIPQLIKIEKTIKTDSIKTKNKNKNSVIKEFNVFDSLITKNILELSNLANDIQRNELTAEWSTNEMTKNSQEQPTTVTLAHVKEGKKNRINKFENLKVLVDTGASDSIVHSRYVQKKFKSKKAFSTGNGTLNTKYESTLNIELPEFSDKKIITWNFSVADTSKIGYDLIIGRDLMNKLEMNISFENKTISWEGNEVPMRDYKKLKRWNLSAHELQVIIQEMQEPVITKEATDRMIKILDSKYDKANLKCVVDGAKHLSEIQKQQLYKLLTKYQEVFDGTLGEWKTTPVQFELREGATPHSQRHYSVPHLYKETFKKELERLENLGVLEKVQSSEWGSPTFIIPKKDGRVRFISDFRKLNQKIKRKPYPLPRISDTLQELEGFQYATSLDMNMGYYHIALSPEASDMCTIVTEFGKYRYKRLPMGVSCSPDIFQAKINELLGDIEGTRAYIDDILVIKRGTFDEHLAQLEEIFQRCQKTGLKLNAVKCRFGINEIDYLGYIVTPTGIKPNPKKIKAIQNMERPRTVTEVRRLIGMLAGINYSLW